MVGRRVSEDRRIWKNSWRVLRRPLQFECFSTWNHIADGHRHRRYTNITRVIIIYWRSTCIGTYLRAMRTEYGHTKRKITTPKSHCRRVRRGGGSTRAISIKGKNRLTTENRNETNGRDARNVLHATAHNTESGPRAGAPSSTRPRTEKSDRWCHPRRRRQWFAPENCRRGRHGEKI